MAKFVAFVAVVVLMMLLTEAKESESAHQRAAAEMSRQARSMSDVIARAMKRSNQKSDECAGFGDECSYWTSCCEGQGLVCESDTDGWFSKGTCWIKY